MRYFTYKEFDCPMGGDGSGRKNMNREFLKFLDELRSRCSFKFIVSSGYRTQAYQDDLKRRGYKTSKSRSAHQDGMAADIKISDSKKRALFIGYALELTQEMDLPFRLGIAGKEKGNFCHINIDKKRSNPRVWCY